jgi:hydroxymethylpyrimidine pyrophosphatase-like HAD family hydrolase
MPPRRTVERNMHNYYVGFDRDGTLELPGLPVPEQLRRQLHRFQDAGARLFIASGKSYDVLRPICAEIGLRPWMYACENGGHIVFPATGNEYVREADADLKRFVAAVDTLDLPPFQEEAKRSIWSKKFGAESLRAKAIIDDFVTQRGLNLDVFAYPDGDGGLDVVPRGIDKVNLLRFLPPDAVIHYFGDGDNDLGIMRAARVQPHTVANAKPVVKACVAARGGHVSALRAGYGVAEGLALLAGERLDTAA